MATHAAAPDRPVEETDSSTEARQADALLKTGALQRAIFNSANFSSIATDAKGVVQINTARQAVEDERQKLVDEIGEHLLEQGRVADELRQSSDCPDKQVGVFWAVIIEVPERLRDSERVGC